MISLSKFIPLNELGEATAKPFDYEPKFKKAYKHGYNGYQLEFKDDNQDIISIEFYGGNIDDWYIGFTKTFYTPSETYNVGFSVNKVEVDDTIDNNSKAKQTDIQYYNRLLTTLKNITYDFIKQFKPNCIFAGKFDSGRKNNQKETRYEMYSRLFRNNITPGYEYFNVGNNIAVGIVKSEERQKIELYE